MSRRFVIMILSMAVFLLAAGIADGQSAMDISIPGTFSVSPTKAYTSSSDPSDVRGPVDVFNYGGGVYVTIPTNAPDGERLSFFQDTGTWALFRNNTLVLPITDERGQVASFVLATGDLNSSGGKFYGRVTGIELDTKAMNSGNASIVAALYLNELPGTASYRLSLSEDENIKKAVLSQAAKDGTAGDIRLTLEVTGNSPDSQGSIAYAIVRMKPGEAVNGNITAYRYYGGTVSQLPCKAIRLENGTVYETISPGPGYIAFIGPAVDVPPVRASMNTTVMFSGVLFVVLLGLVLAAVRILKKGK